MFRSVTQTGCKFRNKANNPNLTQRSHKEQSSEKTAQKFVDSDAESGETLPRPMTSPKVPEDGGLLRPRPEEEEEEAQAEDRAEPEDEEGSDRERRRSRSDPMAGRAAFAAARSEKDVSQKQRASVYQALRRVMAGSNIPKNVLAQWAAAKQDPRSIFWRLLLLLLLLIQ